MPIHRLLPQPIMRFFQRIFVIGGLLLLLLTGLLISARQETSTVSAWVAYVTPADGLWVVRADGELSRQLVADVPEPSSIGWVSPDDIIFRNPMADLAAGLYRVNRAGGEPDALVAPSAVGPIYHLQFVPDAIYYLQQLNGGRRIIELFRYDLATDETRRVTNQADAPPDYTLTDYAISPDGSQIVYIIQIARGPTTAYLMQADGSNIQPLRPDRAITQLRWSADNWLIGLMYDSSGPRLFRMRPDGSEFATLFSVLHAVYSFALSPDGQWVAYSADCPVISGICIYQARTDGTRVVRTGITGRYLDNEGYSPDGDWLLYWDSAEYPNTLSKMRVDGSERQLLATIQQTGNAAWSPPLDNKWEGGGMSLGVGLVAIFISGIIGFSRSRLMGIKG